MSLSRILLPDQLSGSIIEHADISAACTAVQAAGHFRLLCTGRIHVRCRCRIDTTERRPEPRLSVESYQKMRVEWDLHGLEKVRCKSPIIHMFTVNNASFGLC